MNNPIKLPSMKGVDLSKISEQPVTVFVSTIIIVVTLLYFFGILKDIPCGHGVLKGLNRTFIHANWQHIVANLFAFFVLSRIEARYGSRFFAALIIQILVVSSIIELIAQQFLDLKCSIGFSGVLFGLVSWELINNGKDINITLFLSLAAMVVMPSLKDTKASLAGHAIGAISGLLVAAYYKPQVNKIV